MGHFHFVLQLGLYLYWGGGGGGQGKEEGEEVFHAVPFCGCPFPNILWEAMHDNGTAQHLYSYMNVTKNKSINSKLES